MWSLKRTVYWIVRVIVFIVYGAIAPYAFNFGVRYSYQTPIRFLSLAHDILAFAILHQMARPSAYPRIKN